MRFAYADPPYVGQAKKHYSHDPKCAEVNMEDLISDLEREYDGWALSMSVTRDSLLAIIPHMPEGSRLAAWVKPFASFKRGVDPAYTWEMILYRTRRRWSPFQNTVRDHVIENITMKKGLVGVKPERFCFWMFDLLGMKAEDQFVDIFPGSGAVSAAWLKWQSSRTELTR